MPRIVKKPQERRQEIISASRELFLQRDYESITMQDIMQKLQIAKGTTYHYFRSKAELLEAVVQDIVEEYIVQVEKTLVASEGNALERMKVLVTAGRVAKNQHETLEQLHRPGNAGLHVRLLAVTLSRLAPLYAHLIEQGCNEGLFHTDYPLECAEFLLAGIQFLTDVGCYPWSPDDLNRRAQAIPALLEVQLKAPKGSFAFLLNP